MGTNWQVLRDLRSRAQDRAQERVKESSAREQKTVASLNQILELIREYKSELAKYEADGAPISTLVRTRAAIKQLSDSAAKQEQLLLELSYVLEQDKKDLLACSCELKAVEKLQGNARALALKTRRHKEDKELDELARRQYLANLSTP